MNVKVKNTLALSAQTIRDSLALMIPILFIGSITVLLNSFPIMAYQEFLDSFLSGALRSIIISTQKSTVGLLAVYITVALNLSYMKKRDEGLRLVFRFGSLLSCLIGFFILVGLFSGDPDLSLLSGQGVFSAMVAGIAGSALFRKFESIFKTPKMLFVDGADTEFNAALHVIMPLLGVTVCFATFNYLITVCFGVPSMQHLFAKAVDAIFIRMHRSYSSGLLFITLISSMWWFGIHGNNVLNQVAEDMFTAIIPGEIVSKSFIDSFVNIGGTGCTLGLLIAMIIFGKRSSTKKLSGMAFLPGMFNIGELLVFGFPIIYNPLMIIPFILAPILCYSNAFILAKVGFMPVVTNEVIWTTPALMSGYIATGSVRGVIVQLLNLIISTACYAPFVIMIEKRSLDEFSSFMDVLTEKFKESEESGEEIMFTQSEGNIGRLAKLLATDLEAALLSSDKPLKVEYDLLREGEKCRGAEAYLTWDHKRCGEVYTPLVIKIAKESGDLYDLETYILERAISESGNYREEYGKDFYVSVNITAETFADKRFISFLQEMAVRYKLKTGNVCIKVSDKAFLNANEAIEKIVRKIRSFGYIVE